MLFLLTNQNTLYTKVIHIDDITMSSDSYAHVLARLYEAVRAVFVDLWSGLYVRVTAQFKFVFPLPLQLSHYPGGEKQAAQHSAPCCHSTGNSTYLGGGGLTGGSLSRPVAVTITGQLLGPIQGVFWDAREGALRVEHGLDA